MALEYRGVKIKLSEGGRDLGFFGDFQWFYVNIEGFYGILSVIYMEKCTDFFRSILPLNECLWQVFGASARYFFQAEEK